MDKHIAGYGGRTCCWFVTQNGIPGRGRKRDGKELAPVHVPWGLLFDWPESKRNGRLTSEELKSGFWCMKYDTCTILAQSSEPRSLDEPLKLDLTPTQIIGIFTKQATDFLGSGPEGWPSDAACYSTSELKHRVREMDDALLYFFCHANGEILQLSRPGNASPEKLKPQMLRQWLSKTTAKTHRAFFFLNGCRTCATADGAEWLSAAASMKFLGIIVTEAVVPTRFAWRFGRDLLRQTLVDRKSPLDAMGDLRQLHWPLGLLYGLYSYSKKAAITAPGFQLPSPADENYSRTLWFGNKNPFSTLPFRGVE